LLLLLLLAVLVVYTSQLGDLLNYNARSSVGSCVLWSHVLVDWLTADRQQSIRAKPSFYNPGSSSIATVESEQQKRAPRRLLALRA